MHICAKHLTPLLKQVSIYSTRNLIQDYIKGTVPERRFNRSLNTAWLGLQLSFGTCVDTEATRVIISKDSLDAPSFTLYRYQGRIHVFS